MGLYKMIPYILKCQNMIVRGGHMKYIYEVYMRYINVYYILVQHASLNLVN